MMIPNKRGQDLSIGTLILIVLGIIVLVVLVIGFTQGFDFFSSKFTLIPGQALETVAQSCNLAAQSDLRVDFCEFKKIKYQGKTEYVNCEDTRIEGSIESNTRPTCDSNAEFNYCSNVINSKDVNKTIVNGLTCNQYGVVGGEKLSCELLGLRSPGLQGEWLIITNAAQTPQTFTVTVNGVTKTKQASNPADLNDICTNAAYLRGTIAIKSQLADDDYAENVDARLARNEIPGVCCIFPQTFSVS